MNILLPLFIGTSIFGVGVTLIDMLGLLGSQFGESSGGTEDGADAGEADADTDMDMDTDSDTDSDADTDMDTDTDSDADADTDTDGDAGAEDAEGGDTSHGDHDESGQSAIAHDYSPKRNVLLIFLTILRNLVYFCFGFGPVGWFLAGTGSSAIVSLAWAFPLGLMTLGGARLIKRIQRRKLDSQVHDSELLMEMAEVLVTIDKGQLGKVRISYGDTVVDRYAKAQNLQDRYPAGTKVRVVHITDEYVVVSQDE